MKTQIHTTNAIYLVTGKVCYQLDPNLKCVKTTHRVGYSKGTRWEDEEECYIPINHILSIKYIAAKEGS